MPEKEWVMGVFERGSWKRLALTATLHVLVILAVWMAPRRPAAVIDSRPVDVRLIDSIRRDTLVVAEALPVPSRPAPTLLFAPPPEVPVVTNNTQLNVRVQTEDPTPKPQLPEPRLAAEEPPRQAAASSTLAAPPSAAAPDPNAPASTLARVLDVSKVSYLQAPQPLYPLPSRRAREEGRVDVQTLVDIHGAPQQVHVTRSSGFDRLDAAALAAVRAARFRPHTENGVPRAFWVVVPVVFELDL
jgi:periplasmic protein TonB